MSYLFSNGLNRRSMLKTMAAGAGLAGAGTLVNIVPGFAQDTFKVSGLLTKKSLTSST